MDEILKKLLESDVLSEETRAALTEQFKSSVDAFLAEERTKLEKEITLQLTEEFVTAREALTEAVNAKVDEVLGSEFDELKEDINKFRDLEVEYAEKLVEEKEALATKVSEELDQLVDKLDAYLDYTLKGELDELKEDIGQVKKLEFGRSIFEAMETEFKKHRSADLGAQERELAEAKDALADASKLIDKMKRERMAEERTTKMDELLSPLSGNAHAQMKIILSNIATEKLDEAYKVYLSRVLKESVVTPAKAATAPEAIVETAKAAISESKIVTGNEETVVEAAATPATPNSDQLTRIRRLAGLA
jgi:hypothetical protein